MAYPLSKDMEERQKIAVTSFSVLLPHIFILFDKWENSSCFIDACIEEEIPQRIGLILKHNFIKITDYAVFYQWIGLSAIDIAFLYSGADTNFKRFQEEYIQKKCAEKIIRKIGNSLEDLQKQIA